MTMASVVLIALTGCARSNGVHTSHSAPAATSSAAHAKPAWPDQCHLPRNSLRASIPQPGIDVFVRRSAASNTLGTVVLLSNQSDEELCSWLPMTKKFAANDIASAVYNYSGSPLGDIDAIAEWLRTRGADHIVYMGASEGAKASLIAAADKPKPAAVVSLSAEEALGNQPVSPYVTGLHMPLMFVTASHDPYGSTAASKNFHKQAPATVKPLVVRNGDKHGTALLDSALMKRIVKFVHAHAD